MKTRGGYVRTSLSWLTKYGPKVVSIEEEKWGKCITIPKHPARIQGIITF